MVIPVKRFKSAKRRLDRAPEGEPGGAPEGGLDRRARIRVAGAMVDDVLEALGRAASLERIVVVTGERRAERLALERAKRTTTPIEVLRDPSDRGHSEAATLGTLRALALGAQCVALLPGDCPLLDADELDGALARMAPGRVAIIPDRHGSGTNGLLLSPPRAIAPAFGEGSRERHERLARAAGHEVAVEPLASLGLDLDTPQDLVAMGVELERRPERAPRTAAALRELAAEAGAVADAPGVPS